MRIRTNFNQAQTDKALEPQPNYAKDMTGKISICIVEDTPYLADELQTGLEAIEDIKLLAQYENGEEAVRGILQKKPDVVVMDIGLPGMNGIECMMHIRRKNPDIQFMMFTIFENSDKVFEALKVGALGYILKREGVIGVVNGVRELKAGGSPMSRSIARKVLSSFQQTRNPLEQLTNRELEVLNLLSRGLQYKEIAGQLNPQVVEGTVKQHINNIYKKLEVNNRLEAVNKYLDRE